MSLTTDTVITSIDSALRTCSVMNEFYDFKYVLAQKLSFSLDKLKMFVLICGRKSGSHASLRCFLGRMEDIVHINADKIHRQFGDNLISDDDQTAHHLMDMVIYEFNGDIKSLEEEIDELHLKVLEEESITTCIEVLKIITSFLHDLLFFASQMEWIDYVAMEQEILFLKSLIGFVSKRCVLQVEPLKDLSHLFIRAINHLSAEEYQKQLPNDFRDYENFARALSSSKLQSPLIAFTDDDTFTATKNFLDSLISHLWDLLRLNTYSCSWHASFKDDLRELYGELRSLRVLLKHMPQQLQWPKIKLDDIGEVVCDAGFFICALHQTHAEDNHLVLLHNLLKTLRSSILVEGGAEPFSKKLEDVPVAAANKEEIVEAKEVTAKSYSRVMPSQEEGAASLANESFVGFHDDQTLTVDRLTRGSKKLQIVAIVGMPGLGKTTLATRVYTNHSVSEYFSVRAWTTVSQVLDEKKVLLDLFNQIDPIKCSKISANPQPDIADGLRKSLKGRKYLIFLDDMWDTDAWDSLRASLPDDNVGSRIILTSRRHDVAPLDLMVDRKPHFLHQLDEEESVELFQNKLSYGNGILPPLSRDLGRKIAEKCRGLPLMIVIVAGLLKSMEPEDWNAILDGMRNDHMHYKNTLELSYSHLPPHLRPCLVYFGAFKEDEEVSVRRLIRLWIAEGFIQTNNSKSPEEVAEKYLRDLIGRSLIMVAKQRWDGGVKACRIHDLLHEFCIQKAKDEHLFHFLKGYDELSAFNEPHTLQRLCIHSEVKNFSQSMLFCPRARSLIYNYSQSDQSIPSTYNSELSCFRIMSIIEISKGLRILDLEQVELGYMFPTEIKQLVQLAFLAIRCRVSRIPSFIGNLSHLETFIFQHDDRWPARLPDSLWNLQTLQYLYIKNFRGGCLPKSNLESLHTLDELDRFSGANIRYSKMKNQLGKIQNVRKLECIVSCKVDAGQNHVVNQFSFEILKRLESLHLKVDCNSSYMFSDFTLPATLKKLTLNLLQLSWRNLSTVGKLQQLQVLKLLDVHLEGETWEMKEGEFHQLRILKLYNSKLVKWVTNCEDDDEDQLGYFEKLVLDYCHNLEELPSCLDIIPALDVIEVSKCYPKQADLVRQIKERREANIGDRSLKIITSYTIDQYY